MTDIKAQIEQISFFKGMNVSPEKLHEVDLMQRELFNSLDALVHNFSVIDNAQYNKIPFDFSESLENTSRSYFRQMCKLTGNEFQAFNFIATTIANFADHSYEKYGYSAILRNDAFDDLLENKAVVSGRRNDVYDAICDEMNIFNKFDNENISKSSDEYFVGYMKALANIHKILDGNLNKAFSLIAAKTDTGDTNKPCPVVMQHQLYPLVAEKFNLPLK